MTGPREDRSLARQGDSVTLPRWFVVLLVGALTGALGAFWRLDTRLAEVGTRLAVIEYRLGLPTRVSQPWAVPDATPPAVAGPQPVAP